MRQSRICSECTEPNLNLVSRELKTFNTEALFECTKCGHQVTLVPPASIGVNMTVGLLALGFWGFILFGSHVGPDVFSIVIFSIAVFAWAGVSLPPLAAHWLHPSAGKHDPATEGPDRAAVPQSGHVAHGVIVWIERFSFTTGLLAPFIAIGLVLGVATLIGYINFTCFG